LPKVVFSALPLTLTLPQRKRKDLLAVAITEKKLIPDSSEKEKQELLI